MACVTTNLGENFDCRGLRFFVFFTKVELFWFVPSSLIWQNNARTGPRSEDRFKLQVHARSKLTKCPEQEQLKWLLGPSLLWMGLEVSPVKVALNRAFDWLSSCRHKCAVGITVQLQSSYKQFDFYFPNALRQSKRFCMTVFRNSVSAPLATRANV